MQNAKLLIKQPSLNNKDLRLIVKICEGFMENLNKQHKNKVS